MPRNRRQPVQGPASRKAVEAPPPPGEPVDVLTSEILQRLHDASPKEHFTLGWLMSMLDKRSFGLIMLMCAVVAVVPGVSIVAGLLLIIVAVQMIEGRPAPAFPDGLADRPLPARASRVRHPAVSAGAQISRADRPSALADPA